MHLITIKEAQKGEIETQQNRANYFEQLYTQASGEIERLRTELKAEEEDSEKCYLKLQKAKNEEIEALKQALSKAVDYISVNVDDSRKKVNFLEEIENLLK
jgi:DNA polymerase sigma